MSNKLIFPSWSLAEPSHSPPPRVAWVQERPGTMVGGWEPLSFRRRTGYAWEDAETYVREQEFSIHALVADGLFADTGMFGACPVP